MRAFERAGRDQSRRFSDSLHPLTVLLSTCHLIPPVVEPGVRPGMPPLLIGFAFAHSRESPLSVPRHVRARPCIPAIRRLLRMQQLQVSAPPHRRKSSEVVSTAETPSHAPTVGRSLADSGIGLGFAHTISDRRNHPASCIAIATRAGIINRFFPVIASP